MLSTRSAYENFRLQHDYNKEDVVIQMLKGRAGTSVMKGRKRYKNPMMRMKLVDRSHNEDRAGDIEKEGDGTLNIREHIQLHG